VISCRELSKTYQLGIERASAKGVIISSTRGERIASWGASGSGKSTLLHLLAAWIKSVAQLQILGQDCCNK